MKFNVLDRSIDLKKNCLLEASAGTGKTFSIQNLVIRFLLGVDERDESIPIQHQLIVTFTKAATRDLRNRIRSNIEQVLEWLSGASVQNIPDFLTVIKEKGEDSIKRAIRKLQRALLEFDQAHIYTIHSFCSRMLHQFALESSLGLSALENNESISIPFLKKSVLDFFQTHLTKERFHYSQLEIYLKKDPEQHHLLKLIQAPFSFKEFPPYHLIYHELCKKLLFLKESCLLSSDKLLEDFKNQADNYRNYKSGESKAETLKKIIRFTTLFERDAWDEEAIEILIKDGLVWNQALNPSLLKANKRANDHLNYPNAPALFETHLKPLVDELSDIGILLARLAGDCQKFIANIHSEKELFLPDDILQKMAITLKNPVFLKKVQEQYQVAIIDEFQDTDSIQWDIFSSLFLSKTFPWKGYLYLVGDPKQSIYSFRQADIYTYLKAGQSIGCDAIFSLDINFRSQPSLVAALNVLFTSAKEWIPLPRENTALEYKWVEAGKNEEMLSDGLPLHICIVDGAYFKKISEIEKEVFFPFIAREIIRLNKEKGIGFNQFAILVRDRHQGKRLEEYLKLKNIPTSNQRGGSLTDSQAFQSIIAIIEAIVMMQERGAIKKAFGSHLIGWSDEQVKDESLFPFMLASLHILRKEFIERGVAALFDSLFNMKRNPHSEITCLEHLLERADGYEIYLDTLQIVDVILDHQYKEWSLSEGLLQFLDNIQESEDDDQGNLKRKTEEDGVQLLTIHYSKGLEFDIVFPLGLIGRKEIKSELFPIEKDGKYLMTPKMSHESEFFNYCEELDSEKMRQLYVALTRARSKLYLPVIINQLSESLKYGEASSIDLFIARLGRHAPSYHELYEIIKKNSGESLFDFLEKNKKVIQWNVFSKPLDEIVPLRAHHEEIAEEISFTPPKSIKVGGKQLFMSSFSSFAHTISKRHLLDVPSDYMTEEKHPHTLPANQETGILIHSILERIEFRSFKQFNCHRDALPLIAPYIHGTCFQGWEEVFAEMIFNVLKTPFLPNGSSLSEIDHGSMYREIPFLYPTLAREKIEGIELKEGFLKGVIDCLFAHRGMYYIVDWKSNWLGKNIAYYEPAFLEIAMKENHYFLQARIYIEAVKKYLKLVEKRPFKECFGGIYYLFLRGIHPEKKSGIYSF